MVAHFLKAHLDEWAKHGIVDVSLFWDWASLHQKPRSANQEELFKMGLKASKIWYGSAHSDVWTGAQFTKSLPCLGSMRRVCMWSSVSIMCVSKAVVDACTLHHCICHVWTRWFCLCIKQIHAVSCCGAHDVNDEFHRQQPIIPSDPEFDGGSSRPRHARFRTQKCRLASSSVNSGAKCSPRIFVTCFLFLAMCHDGFCFMQTSSADVVGNAHNPKSIT